jgi:transaldolase
MKIFLDTAGVDEIRRAARWGVLDGVTTNPSLFAKVGGSYDDVLKQICQITPGPVSAEVVADDVEGMLREGRHFAKLASNIFVKIPMTENGLEAIARLAAEGIRTNCTLIFSSNQGLLAARRAPRCCRRSWDASMTSTRTAWTSSASSWPSSRPTAWTRRSWPPPSAARAT